MAGLEEGGRGACQGRGRDGSLERDGAFLMVEGAALNGYPPWAWWMVFVTNHPLPSLFSRVTRCSTTILPVLGAGEVVCCCVLHAFYVATH